MRSLSCSLAGGVLADTILIPPIPLSNIRKVRGHKKIQKVMKKEILGWLNASLKSTETRD